jgi:TolB protein
MEEAPLHTRRWIALGALLVTLALGGTAQATFKGQNGRISFARLSAPPWAAFTASLFTSAADGSGTRALTALGAGSTSLYSDWSPSGDRVAFDSDATGLPQIWTTAPDGTGARRLTDSPSPVFDPAWSPAGDTLAVDADFGEDPGIWIIPYKRSGLVTRKDAQRVTRVTGGGYDSEPQFSPDGKWIAFTRYSAACAQNLVAGCTTAIYRVRTNGTQLQLLAEPAYNPSAPDFSPDGATIAFDTHDVDIGPNVGHIMLMKSNGSSKRTVVRGDALSYWQNPSFSPDGRRLVMNRYLATVGPPEVWTGRTTGGDLRRVSSSLGGDYKPDWGSTGRRDDDD